jgi:periplasmic protein TonB
MNRRGVAMIAVVLSCALSIGTAAGQTSLPNLGRYAPLPEPWEGVVKVYLAKVQQRIAEKWQGRALEGRQPVITFEIGQDGNVSNVSVKDSSGNMYYDRAAMRTIRDAAPFPPLPKDLPGPTLRVHLGFNFTPRNP